MDRAARHVEQEHNPRRAVRGVTMVTSLAGMMKVRSSFPGRGRHLPPKSRSRLRRGGPLSRKIYNFSNGRPITASNRFWLFCVLRPSSSFHLCSEHPLDGPLEANLLGPRKPHRRNRMALQVTVAGTVAFAALVLAHGADNGVRARIWPARAHA